MNRKTPAIWTLGKFWLGL